MERISTVRKAGFSLVEFIIILLITGILAAFLVPKYHEIRLNAIESGEEAVIGGLREALNIYAAEHQGASYNGNPFDLLAASPPNKVISSLTGGELIADGTVWKVLRVEVGLGEVDYAIFCPHVGDGQGTTWKYSYFKVSHTGSLVELRDYGH